MRQVFLFIFLILTLNNCSKDNDMQPKAEKIPFKFKVHNQEIVDDYAWLRDKNWPKVSDPKILDYLTQENEHTKTHLSKLSGLNQLIFAELESRIKLTDTSVFTKKKDYYYYSRTKFDKNYPIYCRKHGSMEQGKEEILLDVNLLAKDKKYTKVSTLAVSPSQNLLAYSVDDSGGERYTIVVKDLKSGKILTDKIPSTVGPIVWHEDESGFFYTPVNEEWRHNKVMFHYLGSDESNDKLIMHDENITNSLYIQKSSSKEYFFISSNTGHDSTEIYYFPMTDKEFKPKKIISRKDKIQYEIEHSGKNFYVRTNDQGPNFRLATIDASDPDENKMEDYLPYDKDAYLKSFDVTQNYLVANFKQNALPSLVVYKLDTKSEHKLSLPDEVYTASGYSTNFEEDDLRVDYSSLKTPETTFAYDFERQLFHILKRREVPSIFYRDEYEVERVYADNNGVKVPLTLFYKKSLFKKDGTNPLYLYGYGSYGISIPTGFRNMAVTLADRGFVFAIAHIRGGDDLGFEWYESAKFLNKKNTFEDFIHSAYYLIEERYTGKGLITISGGSAGGLLIGATLNSEPELFKAAVAHVPFVDVLNTMLDETLPLTPGEFKEWGNPKEREYFDYIISYSPYENVDIKNYPNLFVTAGISDPRVGYWEAAKWVAKIRDKNRSDNIILLKTNMDAGHGGASGRFDYLREVAEELAFVFSLYGIKR